MNSHRYSHLLNFAWYQLLWFTAVVGGNSLAWLFAPLLALHLLRVVCWRSELLLMMGVALLGGGVDSAIAGAGYYVFDPAPQILPIPIWLVAIWLGFAGTLRHSLGWLIARPKLLAAMASVGAPLTYMAAARLGAVSFPLGAWPTALVIGLGWAALTPALHWLFSYSERIKGKRLPILDLMFMRKIENG